MNGDSEGLKLMAFYIEQIVTFEDESAFLSLRFGFISKRREEELLSCERSASKMG